MKAIKFILAVLLSITVVACGGGGGSSTPAAPATPTTYSVSGAVTGDATSGVTITLSGASSATTTTAAGGAYSFTGLADGSYTVTPSLTGYTFNPASTSITVSGADVITGAGFAATANSSALATVSGTITGPWVQSVKITMSGGASGTTTTDSSGNYSFANVASGASYTFTPSLSGYTYANASETVAIPGGNTAPVTVPNMVASSVIPSSSVSGTITYAGILSGGIRLRVHDASCTSYCTNYASIYLPDPGAPFTNVPFTIRGLRPTGAYNTPGQYVVQAFIVNVPSRAINASDPRGNSAAFSTTAGTNVTTGADIIITDQSPAAPATMAAPGVAPGPSSALIQYDAPVDSSGKETAISYTLTYATDSGFTTGVTPVSIAAQGTNQAVYILNGLTNSQQYWFKITATNGTGTSADSPVTGPVMIGDTTGSATVAGSVSFTGDATGHQMLVGVHSNTTGAVYYTTVSSPVSPQSYSVSGIPDGDYDNFAIIDMNDDNKINTGDITNVNDQQAPSITVSGGAVTVGTGNITLSSANSSVQINTDHQSDGSSDNYALILSNTDGIKRIRNLTMVAGPDLSVPFDLGPHRYDGLGIPLGTVSPTVGTNIYTFLAEYSDGTKQTLKVSVAPVANFFAQSLTAVTTGAGTTSAPQFTWMAPISPPSFYTYSLNLYGTGTNWSYPSDGDMPSSQTSVVYNVDGNASPNAPLSTGTYYWTIQVRDSNGNSATYQAAPYVAP
jgi:hypothetical protein